jgi:uncharacterized protein (TIGR00255 family)
MSLESMTGFGRCDGASSTAQWSIEIKSVNGRGLDVRLKVPPALEKLEPQIRQHVSMRFARGSFQLSITQQKSANASTIRINEPLLEALLDQLTMLAARKGVAPVTLDALLGIKGVVETNESADFGPEESGQGAEILRALDVALDELKSARREEGKALERILSAQLGEMQATLKSAAEARDAQADTMRERLLQQVEALMGGASRVDPQRLHQEAALLATRADVREELDRLATHIAASAALLTTEGAVGRRLDFLAQELSREANTLCAKASNPGLTKAGLDLKALVEQFREQVQNVE